MKIEKTSLYSSKIFFRNTLELRGELYTILGEPNGLSGRIFAP